MKIFTNQNPRNINTGTIAALLMLAPWSSGCAHTRSNEEFVVQSTEHITDPVRQLQARAEIELLKPSTPVPEHLLTSFDSSSIAMVHAGSHAYRKAMLPQKDIQQKIWDRFPYIFEITQAENAESPVEVEPARKSHALKLYTRALVFEQSNQYDTAIELLLKATESDPHSSTLARKLGEAYLHTQDLINARVYLEHAIELGDRNYSTCIRLASIANESEDSERVLAWIFAAQLLESEQSHSTASSIGNALLGLNSIRSGYLYFGAETLSSAISQFDVQDRDPMWRREIIAFHGNIPSLWLLVGDSWSALRAYTRSQEAYESARSFSNQRVPKELVARQIQSALRSGQRLWATSLMLDHVLQHGHDLGNEERQWAKAFSQIDNLGSVLGDSIEQSIHKLVTKPESIASQSVSTQQSLLRVEVLARPHSDSIERLLRCDSKLLSVEAIEYALRQRGSDAEKLSIATQLTHAHPTRVDVISSALIRSVEHPVDVLAGSANATDLAQQCILTSMGLSLGRPDLVTHQATSDVTLLQDVANQSTESIDDVLLGTWLGLHTQAAALMGDWELCRSHIKHLEELWNTHRQLHIGMMYASSLAVAQRPQDAFEVSEALMLQEVPSVVVLEHGANIAMANQLDDVAIEYLNQALDIDPYNDSIAELLIGLYANQAAIARSLDDEEISRSIDQERFRVLRTLNTHRPNSRVLGVLRAAETARDGSLLTALSMINQLNPMDETSTVGLDLSMTIWETLDENSDEHQALSEGIDWLENRHQLEPNAAPITLALAQAYYKSGQPEQSLSVLESAYERTGSFSVARAREEVMIDQGSAPETVAELRRDRLANLNGIDSTLESVGYLIEDASAESLHQAYETLNTHLPSSIELLPEQETQLTRALLFMTRVLSELDQQDLYTGLYEVIEQLESKLLNPLNFETAQVKLLMLSNIESTPVKQLFEVSNELVSLFENQQEQDTLSALPIQALLSQERHSEAITLTTLKLIQDKEIDETSLIDTFRLLGAFGTNADLLRVLDLIDSRNLLPTSIQLTTELLGTPERGGVPQDSEKQRADIAYTAAAMASAFDRSEQAARYYELSLSFDPDHPWSNNDFGYMLAERGERIEYAVELLERAMNALPNEASIVDSLAWVRYKLGIFEDVLDAQGQVISQGAVSLLIRANELDTERTNATILLHLGDALWRVQQTEKALEAWLEGENMLRSEIRLERAKTDPNMNLIESHEAELREIRHRIQDAELNGNPSISPLAEP